MTSLKHQTISLFVFILTALSCEKNNLTDQPKVVLPDDTTGLKCGNLPPIPQPFGWHDTTFNENINVISFLYNPINLNELFYITSGDIFAYNKMFVLNLVTQQRSYLSNADKFIPQINNKGWVIFNRADLNIYKIKMNGDSLTQLTFNNRCTDPKWDYSGTCIYFFQKSSIHEESKLIQINTKGQILTTYKMEFENTVPSNKNNKILYLKTSENKLAVFIKDLAKNTETLIVKSDYDFGLQQNDFLNLSIDNEDETIYWSNETGIYSCKLTTLKKEQLFKNCETLIYKNPVLSIIKNKMTYSCKIIKAINSTDLFYEYKNFEIDLTTKEIREVKIFQ